MTNYPFKSGDYIAICDFCGFKRRRSEMKMTWENWLVCRDTCWEPRHPQDITPPSFVDRQWVEEPRDRQFINNFSGWFITDPDDTVVKTGEEYNAQFEIEGAWNDTTFVLGYADYGQDYFTGDFVLRCRVKIYLDCDDDVFAFVGVAQVAGDYITMRDNGYALGFRVGRNGSDAILRMEEIEPASTVVAGVTIPDVSFPQEFGVVLTRRGSVRSIEVYKDRFFRQFIAGQSQSFFFDPNQAYQYLYAFNNETFPGGNQHIDISFTQVELR